MDIVFIGGPQRSGTTLIQTLIANALENCFVLPEAHAVHALIEIYKKGMDEWPKSKQFFGDRNSFCKYIRSCVEQIVDSVNRIQGSSEVVVLKDPNFALVHDQISDLFPKATFIFCARDPRDIVCSFLKIEQREADLKLQRKKYRGRNIAFYCSKIKKNYEPALDPEFSAILVRYEDIVSDPEGELMKLAAETGLPLSLPDLNNMQWAGAESRHKVSWITPLEGGMPSTESVGRFKDFLSINEVNDIEKKCASILEKFGYSPVALLSRRSLSERISERFKWLRHHVFLYYRV